MTNNSAHDEVLTTRYLRCAILLALLPIVYCCVFTLLYGCDLPYWDQWRKVPLVIKSFEGTLTLRDCWALNNEHRVFFANLLMIPVARATHWTLGYELTLTILFTLAAYTYILRLLFRETSTTLQQRAYYLIPVISLLMFSFSQRAIWVWGLHTMIPMALLAMLIATRHLIAGEIRPRDMVIALLCAFFASYTFGTGIVLWGMGAVLFSIRIYRGQANAVKWLALWCSSAGLCLWIYFWDYTSIGTESTAQSVITHPLAYSAYLLGYIGGPLVPYHGTGGFMESIHGPVAVFTGLIGLALGFHAIKQTLQHEQAPSLIVRFACALLLMAIGCAMLTGLKQWPEGPSQAASSRYLPWSTMYWVGLLILHASVTKPFPVRKPTLIITVFLLSCGSLYGTYKAQERHSAFELGKASLIDGIDDGNLRWVYPTPDIPLEYRDDLIKHRLTIFRYTSLPKDTENR